MDRGAKLRKLGLEQDVAPIRVFCKVSDGTRTRDRLDHNPKAPAELGCLWLYSAP